MSVEKTSSGYRVRWRQRGQNRARSGFTSRRAAEKFDRHVQDLRAAGELHLLDEEPAGVMQLGEYVSEVWWPEYAAVRLTRETQANYAVQLDLRIIPAWGRTPLRALRPAAIEAWVNDLGRQGVGDPTVLRTLAVMRGILKRAERDGQIDRNPLELVAKPHQRRERPPRPIHPYWVERIRQHLIEPPERHDRRGRVIRPRPVLDRHRDATLVSLLAYAGPRPESEALTVTLGQVARDRLTIVATKSGRPVPREVDLLRPLAQDLAAWRLRCGPADEETLLFAAPRGKDMWGSSDWDNWRERVFQPAAVAVGLPADTRPRDLRASFASLLIFSGMNVVEVAQQLGHSPQTCLRVYAQVFKEADPEQRRPAGDVIREAREQVAADQVPERVHAAQGSLL